MSMITIQVGQCGNQIGEKLFETLAKDLQDPLAIRTAATRFKPQQIQQSKIDINENYVQETKERFFTESAVNSTLLMPRAVLIDMESKVVNKLVAKKANETDSYSCQFREANSYSQKKGSGNNWSYGYCVNAPNSRDKIEEIIRKEVERTDRLSAFMVCMSLAGGTGSGVGSYYTEFLRNNYPRACIVNSCVWPFSTGEVILQNYNFLLTLNKLYEHSDGLVIFENDNLEQACKRLNLTAQATSKARTAYDRKEVTFDDLNSLIAHKLASVLQPCSSYMKSSNYLDEIIADLCPVNDFKLLSLNNVPQVSPGAIEFSSFQWPGLYKHARQLLQTGGFMEEGLNWNDNETQQRTNKTLGVNLFCRGIDAPLSEHLEMKESFFGSKFQEKFFGQEQFCSSVYEPARLWYQPRMFNRYEKSITLLSNSQAPVYKIDSLIEKAWQMFSARAYVHQYTKYANFEEEQLLNAFISTEQLIKNYKSI